MAANSTIKAIIDLYNTLDPSSFPNGVRPPLFFDEVPSAADGATPVQLPYIVFHDNGQMPSWTFKSRPSPTSGQNGILNGDVTLEIYALDLGDCDDILTGLLWNGQVPNNRAGLGFGTLVLNSPQKSMSVVPGRVSREFAGFYVENSRAHKITQTLKTQVAISGDGLFS